MTIEEIKSKFRSEIVKTVYPPTITGGQSCGMPSCGVTLFCPNTEFSISLNEYRSHLKNYDLCLTLYNLFLDEIVK